MANRPVYMVLDKAPWVDVCSPAFEWSPGFAVSQKQKCIRSLHEAWTARFPGRRVLEISSKSFQPGGSELSAFHLMLNVPGTDLRVPVENAYQAGKVFLNGGPYPDLLTVSPREARRDPRLRTGSLLTGFSLGGQTYPVRPVSAYYDWLYLTALTQNPALAATVLQYDGFTDIEFNPEKSTSTQARSAALFAALCRSGRIRPDAMPDFDTFLSLLR